jgi:succinate-semialdehyde dehydrogenase / glutarate-semialdehyde dehydrogenase
MKTQSVNPFNEKVIKKYELWTKQSAEKAILRSVKAGADWKNTPLEERLKLALGLSEALDANKTVWAKTITTEMGKTLKEATLEIEKCGVAAKFLSSKLKEWFATEQVEAPSGKWEVLFEPMGVLVGIMPWNFPFWQVLRFAIPALSLGNTILLKHASNVFGSSELIQKALLEAGYPKDVFQHAPLSSKEVLKIIPNEFVRGVSLTGSTGAGKAVGAIAGANLKKVVLELGGSDAYVILDDADLDLATDKCVASRLQNAGQSCVCAKRFIVTKKNEKQFIDLFVEKMKHKSYGDPMEEGTAFGPLARMDLRDQLHKQVRSAVKGGAKAVLGGEIPDEKGAFYPATVLTNITEKNPVFKEELFGPVASIITAKDEEHAIRLANKSSYGLGSGVFSKDLEKARFVARHRLEAGMSFVNDFVKSDPKIPFGGVKDSGIGRELGRHGVIEFANIKSVVS